MTVSPPVSPSVVAKILMIQKPSVTAGTFVSACLWSFCHSASVQWQSVSRRQTAPLNFLNVRELIASARPASSGSTDVAWQFDGRGEAGLFIAKYEPPAMELSYGFDETEAQAIAGRLSAALNSRESFGDARQGQALEHPGHCREHQSKRTLPAETRVSRMTVPSGVCRCAFSSMLTNA